MAHKYGKLEIDFDEAYSVSAENDGQIDTVYFDVDHDEDGNYYMTAVIDCASASFTDTLTDTDGPYESKDDALWGGINAAFDWHSNNSKGDIEWDTRLKRFLRRF